jgi:hypothetical protein
MYFMAIWYSVEFLWYIYVVILWYIFPFWYAVPRKIWQSCWGSILKKLNF